MFSKSIHLLGGDLIFKDKMPLYCPTSSPALLISVEITTTATNNKYSGS